MSTFKRAFALTLVLGLFAVAAFTAGFLTHAYLQGQREPLPVLSQAYGIFVNNALEPIPDTRQLEYGMIRGMIQAYGDPHSSFLEPPQTELQAQTLQGSFGGIGVRLGNDAEGFYVLYPFADSPAQKAGVLDGDRLLKVEALEVNQQTSLDNLQAAIRGPVGQAVALTIARPPQFEVIELSVDRAEILLPSVAWHIEASEPRVGVIEVFVIADPTVGEIQKAVADLQSRGATHFILDLRNNGGGLLESGVNVARLFLSQGTVIEQQYRGRAVETFGVERPGALEEIPLVVLVNGGTASAAEIIAGSLQAQGRAKIVGQPSYGKDSIQLVFNLLDGSSLHVTSARWWVPQLAPLRGTGLQPDLTVPLDAAPTPDPFISAAIEALFAP